VDRHQPNHGAVEPERLVSRQALVGVDRADIDAVAGGAIEVGDHGRLVARGLAAGDAASWSVNLVEPGQA